MDYTCSQVISIYNFLFQVAGQAESRATDIQKIVKALKDQPWVLIQTGNGQSQHVMARKLWLPVGDMDRTEQHGYFLPPLDFQTLMEEHPKSRELLVLMGAVDFDTSSHDEGKPTILPLGKKMLLC